MNTHVLIWLDAEPEKLSDKAATLIKDTDHQLFLSVVSVWEMQIKVQLGKLTLRAELAELLHDQQAKNSLQILPVLLPHVFTLKQLPPLHKDPFDRLLIAQALHEGFTLLSHDEVIQRYPVPTVWK